MPKRTPCPECGARVSHYTKCPTLARKTERKARRIAFPVSGDGLVVLELIGEFPISEAAWELFMQSLRMNKSDLVERDMPRGDVLKPSDVEDRY